MRIMAKGNSMYPTLLSGNEYSLEKIRYENIKEGDIIVYCIEEVVTCHRVVRVIRTKGNKVFFVTKGDNCTEIDSYLVLPRMILGRVRI